MGFLNDLKNAGKKTSKKLTYDNDPSTLFDYFTSAAQMTSVDKLIQLILFYCYRTLKQLEGVRDIPEDVKSVITVDVIEKEFIEQVNRERLNKIDFDWLEFKAQKHNDRDLAFEVDTAVYRWISFQESVEVFLNVCDKIASAQEDSWETLNGDNQNAIVVFYELLPIMLEYSRLDIMDVYDEIDELDTYEKTKRFEKISALIMEFNEKHSDDNN